MNASFGECETNPTNPATGPAAQVPYGTEIGDELEPVAEPMLEKAAAMGRTLFASAGDTGSGCPEVVVPIVGAGNGVAAGELADRGVAHRIEPAGEPFQRDQGVDQLGAAHR